MTLENYLSFLNSDSFKKTIHNILSTTEKIVLVPRKTPTPISNCTITLAKQPVFGGEWFEMYFEIFIFDKKIEIYKINPINYDDLGNEKPKVPVFSFPAKDIDLFVENLNNVKDYIKNAINEYNKEMVKRYIQYRRNCNKRAKHLSQMKKQISEIV